MKEEKIKKVIHFYTSAGINRLEKWLSDQAANGWRLEQKNGWKFVFRQCQPYTTKYFCYSSFDRGSGIVTEYLISKRQYERARSLIKKADIWIYEVDLSKIDEDFSFFVALRNKEYLKFYLAFLFFSAAILAVSMWINSKAMRIFGFCWLPMLFYSIWSVVSLILAKKR